MSDRKDETAPPRRASWLRENVEAIVVAFVLALLIRQYAMEAFVIPTGSMAPTLLGAHVTLRCTNCGYEEAVAQQVLRSGGVRAANGNARGVCPRCKKEHIRDLPEDAFLAGRAQIACERCKATLVMVPIHGPAGTGERVVRHKCQNCGAYFENRLPRGSFPFEELWPSGPVSRGDRILVDKFSYRFRAPRRFEVIVFKYPVDPSQNFIKRLVGLPGETIDVRAGDIFIDGKIARKPDEMQSDCWKLVNDSRYVEKDPGGGADGRPRAWRGEGGLMKQTAGKTGYELKALGNKPAWIVYNRPIEDENRYNEGSQGSGRNTVGDVRVAFDATIGPKAIVLARLQCDDDIFEAEVAEARALLRRGGTKVGEAEIHFEARKPHRVVLARADARVTLEVDRERLFAYEFDPDGTDAKKSEVRIGVRGEGGMAEATFERIGVSRDVYYLSRIVNSKVDFPYRIGPGQYFAMGDNSANSTDSRAWETVPEGHLTGRAFLVFWPALPGDFAVRRIH